MLLYRNRTAISYFRVLLADGFDARRFSAWFRLTFRNTSNTTRAGTTTLDLPFFRLSKWYSLSHVNLRFRLSCLETEMKGRSGYPITAPCLREKGLAICWPLNTWSIHRQIPGWNSGRCRQSLRIGCFLSGKSIRPSRRLRNVFWNICRSVLLRKTPTLVLMIKWSISPFTWLHWLRTWIIYQPTSQWNCWLSYRGAYNSYWEVA